jgi:hypothetical protein
MSNKNLESISWDSLSKILIVVFLFLQLIRNLIMPQFMDIYYHLQTAWGFLQSGGYCGWDFWQYAPVGRVHIYPPLFHLILALFMKLGLSPDLLAKLCEGIIPWVFLIVTWDFVRQNFSERLGFFVVFSFFLSFSFYLSLLNHAPATLAFIFGILSLGRLLRGQLMRSAILLALSFYTHIGVSIYFYLVFFIYGLVEINRRRPIGKVILITVILASPILLKELAAFKYVSILGFQLNEKYLIQIKVLEYILAVFGLYLAFKSREKYGLFLSFLLASFIFIPYPYRFFSAEGYFAVVFLSALTWDYLCQVLKRKYLLVFACILVLLFSPTLIRDSSSVGSRNFRLQTFDSALLGIILARGQEIWYPQEYISAAEIVKKNSQPKDIVYSTMSITGPIISSFAGRACANGLLPEIKPEREVNPFLTAKIIIFTAIDDQTLISSAVTKFHLVKLGENKLFRIYSNPSCRAQVQVRPAAVPFWVITVIAGCLIFTYIFVKNI